MPRRSAAAWRGCARGWRSSRLRSSRGDRSSRSKRGWPRARTDERASSASLGVRAIRSCRVRADGRALDPAPAQPMSSAGARSSAGAALRGRSVLLLVGRVRFGRRWRHRQQLRFGRHQPLMRARTFSFLSFLPTRPRHRRMRSMQRVMAAWSSSATAVSPRTAGSVASCRTAKARTILWQDGLGPDAPARGRRRASFGPADPGSRSSAVKQAFSSRLADLGHKAVVGDASNCPLGSRARAQACVRVARAAPRSSGTVPRVPESFSTSRRR